MTASTSSPSVSHTRVVESVVQQRTVIANLGYRVFVIAVLLFLALATLGGIYDPVPSADGGGPAWPGWVIIGILALLIVRSTRLGVVIERDNVTTRGFLWNRKISSSRVLTVEATGYSGLMNWGGESGMFTMLRLQLQGGERDLPMVMGRPKTVRRLAETATAAIQANATPGN